MEFWEGAVLVVGGLYLVSRITVKPAGMSTPINSNLSANQSGLTQQTNTAGTSYTVAGESLAAPAATLVSNSVPVRNPVTAAPPSAPLHNNLARPVASPIRRGSIAL